MSGAIKSIFENPLKHKFGVAVGDDHHFRRNCWLDGPILEISDPQNIAPPIGLYLPDWTIDTKDTPSHKTIVLRSTNSSELPQIRMKSRNFDLIDDWAKQMYKSVSDMQYLKLTMANHGVKFNVDGSFISCRFYMTVEDFKFTSKNNIIGQVERSKEIRAAPIFEDPKKIVIYRNDTPLFTIMGSEPARNHMLIVTINSKKPDHQAIPEFIVTHTDVPDIPDTTFQDKIHKALDNFQDQTKDIAGALLRQTPSSGNLSPDIIPSNSATQASSTPTISSSINAGLMDFNQEMITKLKAVLEKIRNSHEPPSIDELIADYLQPYKQEFDVNDPIFNLDNLDDEGPLFEMKRNGATDIFYSSTPRIPLQANYITLADPIDYDYCIESTNRDVPLKNLQKIGFVVPPDRENDLTNFMYVLSSSPPEQRHLVAAALFAQGRRKTYANLSEAIDKHQWQIKELKLSHRDNLFSDLKGLQLYFTFLRQQCLLPHFFQELETMQLFKRTNYHIDAVIRVPGMCDKIASFFFDETGVCNPFSAPLVPFTQSLTLNQIANFQSLHLRFSEALIRFLSSQAELYLVPDRDPLLSSDKNKDLQNKSKGLVKKKEIIPEIKDKDGKETNDETDTKDGKDEKDTKDTKDGKDGKDEKDTKDGIDGIDTEKTKEEEKEKEKEDIISILIREKDRRPDVKQMPLAEIMCWLFKLFPEKYYKLGDFSPLWDLVTKTKSKVSNEYWGPYNKALELSPDPSKENDIKLLIFILQTLADDCIVLWIFTMMAVAQPSHFQFLELIYMEPFLKQLESNDDLDSLSNPLEIAKQMAVEIKQLLSENGSDVINNNN